MTQTEEEKKQYFRDYYQRNKAKKIEQAKQWVKDNPERRAAIAKRRNRKAKRANPEKIRCRALVSQKVKHGRMPRASSLLCYSCGRQAAHWHHHKGYDFEHRYDVLPLCIACHKD